MMKQFTNGIGFLMKSWDKYVIFTKNKLEKILSYLSCLELRRYDKNQRKSLKYPLFILALALLLYIVFHNPIESFISDFLVEPIFSQIDYGPLTSLAIVFLVILYLFGIVKWLNVSVTNTTFLLFLAFIYIYYSTTSDVWIFTTFFWVKCVNYAGIIFLFAVWNLFFLIFRMKPNPQEENGNDGFLDDAPITGKKFDDFDYADYAEIIANKIKISHCKKPFAIGITGKWGMGKTSFINLLKNYLDPDEMVLVDFQPWNSQTPTAILKDLLKTIQVNVRPDYSLAKLVARYSESLLEINESNRSHIIQLVLNIFSGNTSTDQLFESINEYLKQKNKKLIVFIDDLDRLD